MGGYILTLRPYQQRALEGILNAHRTGARVVAAVGPTALGKTTIGAAWAAQQRGTGLFVAHRAELLDQARRALSGIACNFISIQSVDPDVGLPIADYYVLDEFHHFYGAPTWSKSVEPARRGPTLGLTATPERQTGEALGNLADALVVIAQPSELIRDGYLVPCDVIAGKSKTSHLTEEPVAAWKKYAPGTRCVVFCSDIEHAEKIAGDFNLAGIPAASIDGNLSPTLRKERLAEFRSGALTVLAACHILSEGFDQPSIESCIMARGFSSMCAWIQAIGRVVRPYPGKTRAICIDLRGSVYAFGLPEADRVYSLEGKAMRVKQDSGDAVRQCKKCARVFLAAQYGSGVCPGCGATSPGRTDPKIRREELAKIHAAEPMGVRAEFFRRMQALGRSMGYKPQFAAARYKSKYGSYPPRGL